MSYAIKRSYFNSRFPSRIIKSGLTLEEAKAHCADPETSSRTCTGSKACKRTYERGPWFDGFVET
jgi:hypothetical protein